MHKVDGIVTGQMENPLLLMARLADDLGFRFSSPEAIMKARNKFMMKQAFLASGVPCAKGILVKPDEEIAEILINGMEFPLILKPTDAFSSRGVFKVNNLEEITERITMTLSYSTTGDVILEEFMEGPEVSVESVTWNGRTTIIQITDKVITEYPYTVEMAHIQPSALPAATRNEIAQTVVRGIAALGLDQCASHTELKVTPQGVKIVEIGARLGGDYISSYLTFHSTRCNIEKCAVQIALGIEPDTAVKHGHGCEIRYLGLPEGLRVRKIYSTDRVKEIPGFIKVLVNIKEGDLVPKITDSSKRQGFVICKGKDRSESMQNTDRALEALKECIELSNQ